MTPLGLRSRLTNWFTSSPASDKTASADIDAASLNPLLFLAPIAAPIVLSTAALKPAAQGNSWKSLTPLGVVLLGNFAASVGTKLVTDDSPEERLSNHVYDVERLTNGSIGLFGGTTGRVVEATLGRLADGLMIGIELLSEDVATGRNYEREKVRERLLSSSEAFGRQMRKYISLLLIDSIEYPEEKIDWLGFERKLRGLYSQNKDLIDLVYEELEYTGFLCPEAQEIKDLVTVDGSISTGAHEGFKRLVNEELVDILAAYGDEARKILGPDFDAIDLNDLLKPEAAEIFDLTEEQSEALNELDQEIQTLRRARRIFLTETTWL
jgi:hypothetical protein